MLTHKQIENFKQLTLVATTPPTVGKKMKLKYLGAVVSVAVCLVSGISNNKAVAHTQPDYACFFTTTTGETVDFSQSSLCGVQKTVAAPLNTDEAFLAEYKRNALQYAEVRDSLLASTTQSPEVNTMQAKKVCNDLKTGVSLDEIKQKQSRETVEQSSIINAQIITNLATKYYCPNLGN